MTNKHDLSACPMSVGSYNMTINAIIPKFLKLTILEVVDYSLMKNIM